MAETKKNWWDELEYQSSPRPTKPGKAEKAEAPPPRNTAPLPSWAEGLEFQDQSKKTSVLDDAAELAKTAQFAVSDTVDRYGTTMEAAGSSWAPTVRNAAAYIAPSNYTPADFDAFDPKKRSVYQGVRAAIEGAPGFVIDTAAGAGAAGAAVLTGIGAPASPGAGLAGYVASREAREIGRDLENRMKAQGKTLKDATASDWAAVGASGVVQGGLERFGVGKAIGGGKAAGSVIGQIGDAGLGAAGAGAIGNVVNQVGRTAGTKDGLDIDPREAGNAGVLGGASAAAVRGTRGVVRDLPQALKTRDIDPTSAGRVVEAIDASGINPKNASESFKAVNAAEAALSTTLDRTYGNASKHLSLAGDDTQAAVKGHIKLVKDGRTLTKEQIADLETRLGTDPTGNPGYSLLESIRDMNTLNQIKQKGNWNPERETFGGGLAETKLGEFLKPTTAKAQAALQTAAFTGAASLLAPGTAATLGPYAAGGLAAALATRAGMKGIDAATGYNNPLGPIAERFRGSQEGAFPIEKRNIPAVVRDAMAKYNAEQAAKKLAEKTSAKDEKARKTQEDAAWREQNATPQTRQRQLEFERATRQAGMQEPTPAQRAAQEEAVWRDYERTQKAQEQPRAWDAADAPAAIREELQARDAAAKQARARDMARRIVEQQIAKAARPDVNTPAGPQLELPLGARPQVDAASAQPKGQAKPKVEGQPERKPNTYTFEGIDFPLPEAMRNKSGYIASLQRKQKQIIDHVDRAVGEGVDVKTGEALLKNQTDLRTARNAADARNTIERIIKQAHPDDVPHLRDVFGDDFYGIWHKKEAGE